MVLGKKREYTCIFSKCGFAATFTPNSLRMKALNIIRKSVNAVGHGVSGKMKWRF